MTRSRRFALVGLLLLVMVVAGVLVDLAGGGPILRGVASGVAAMIAFVLLTKIAGD